MKTKKSAIRMARVTPAIVDDIITLQIEHDEGEAMIELDIDDARTLARALNELADKQERDRMQWRR